MPNVVFRPWYGCLSGSTYIYSGSETNSINREFNLYGWNISNAVLKIKLFSGTTGSGPQTTLRLYFSGDKGSTWPLSRSYTFTPVYEKDNVWAGGYYYEKEIDLTSDDEALSYLTPFGRIKYDFSGSDQAVCVVYWGPGQTPTPPYDYIDDNNNYVQYCCQLHVTYTEKTISTGSLNFPKGFSTLYDEAKILANAILDLQLPSGVICERKLSSPVWGKDNYVYSYHSSLAAIGLIYMSFIDSENSSKYLVAARRYIEWQFGQQLDDGGYYFGLKEGDLHPIEKKKIDSFSSIVPKLVYLYYLATDNSDVIDNHYSRLLKIGDFLDGLVTDDGVLVDGYTWNEETSSWDKNKWIYTHDNCENYEGYYYLAQICDYKNDTTKRDYYLDKSTNVKNGINNTLWLSEYNRYCYAQHTDTGPDSQIGYPIVTPFTYNIAPLDRYSSIIQFNETCILGGRYYQNNNKEYSTFTGINMCAVAKFTDKPQLWQYYGNNVKFLFWCPSVGKLLNNEGLIDWVDLTTDPPEVSSYRLVECDSWGIEAFVRHLPTYLTNGENSSLITSSPITVSSHRVHYIVVENSSYLGTMFLLDPIPYGEPLTFSITGYNTKSKKTILYHPSKITIETDSFITYFEHVGEESIKLTLQSPTQTIITKIMLEDTQFEDMIPVFVKVDENKVNRVYTEDDFDNSTNSCWYYDSTVKAVWVKAISNSSSDVEVFFSNPLRGFVIWNQDNDNVTNYDVKVTSFGEKNMGRVSIINTLTNKDVLQFLGHKTPIFPIKGVSLSATGSDLLYDLPGTLGYIQFTDDKGENVLPKTKVYFATLNFRNMPGRPFEKIFDLIAYTVS